MKLCVCIHAPSDGETSGAENTNNRKGRRIFIDPNSIEFRLGIGWYVGNKTKTTREKARHWLAVYPRWGADEMICGGSQASNSCFKKGTTSHAAIRLPGSPCGPFPCEASPSDPRVRDQIPGFACSLGIS